MKPIAVLLFAVVAPHIFAAAPGRGTPVCAGADCQFEEVPLGTVKTNGPPAEPLEPKVRQTKAKSHGAIGTPRLKPDTNLPPYYLTVDRRGFTASEKAVFTPESNSAPRLEGVGIGDVFRALLSQSIKASPSVPSPVRAFLLTGPLKGSMMVGLATLDQELKRVLLKFTKLRTTSGGLYSVSASGLSLNGRVGLEGDYHSETGKFFLAELASSTAAAIADSTIQRQQNQLGGWVQEPTLANHFKQGAVSALTKSTSRLADTARSAPEWTEVDGHQEIQIIVEENAIESANQ
jgi:hypothetical protein